MEDYSVEDGFDENIVELIDAKNIEPQADAIDMTIQNFDEEQFLENLNKARKNWMNLMKNKYSEEGITAKKRVAEAIRIFTHTFHKSIADKSEGNFVCSGLSAHSVLSMAAQGAEGATAEAIQRALSLSEDQQQSCVGYQGYINDINNAPKMVLKLANKVYVSSKNKLKETFKETTSMYFNSESESVDFSKTADTTNKINEWCAKATDGKIRNIFSEDSIHGNVNFILINALYFKGIWKKKFVPGSTRVKPYHIDKSTVKEVPMMYNKTYYLYNELEDESAHVVGIPYQNENYCMFIIVPKEINGLANVEKNYDQVKKAFKTLKHTRRITLYLPRFKISSTIDMKSHLCQMGMQGIFAGNADFTGITNQPGGAASVRQKVFIEVNEDGTEAFCLSDFEQLVKYDHNVPLELTVDRPFLYQIYDMTNGIPLFSGRIVDPSIEDSW